jgi:hypothetical protein
MSCPTPPSLGAKPETPYDNNDDNDNNNNNDDDKPVWLNLGCGV